MNTGRNSRLTFPWGRDSHRGASTASLRVVLAVALAMMSTSLAWVSPVSFQVYLVYI